MTVSGHESDTVVSSSRGIGRNTAINMAGAILPLALSLATVPAYLNIVGEARYGVLAIVWVVLGYFAVFDLGLSRATANQIARMRRDSPSARERVFWTALALNATLGVVGGLLLFVVGQALLEKIITISPELHSEAITALPWLSIAVPLTTLTLVLAGTLEGLERFLIVNTLGMSALVMYQVLPLAYAYWISPELPGLIMCATLALLASTALSLFVTGMALPVQNRPKIDKKRVRVLLTYGGWVSVTGLVGPLLTAVDRIVIGSVLGARAVTRYVIPFALVSRVQIVSTSLARTIFPRFSMLDRKDAAQVSRESLRGLAGVITVLTVMGAVALEPFLRIWVGSDIASSSAPVGEILLMGFWVNSLAVVPFAFLQAQGRPDLPAKLHVLELIPYIGGLFVGLHFAGIRGAALAWSARAAVDAALLFWAARRLSDRAAPADLGQLAGGGALAAAACVASLTVFHTTSLRIIVGAALIVASVGWAWRIAPNQARLFLLRPRRS